MGSSQLHPRDDRDARADQFSCVPFADRWSQSGKTDRSQLKQNLMITRRGQSRCCIQPRRRCPAKPCDDVLRRVRPELAPKRLFFSQKILRSGRRIDQRSFAQFFEHVGAKASQASKPPPPPPMTEHIEVQDVDRPASASPGLCRNAGKIRRASSSPESPDCKLIVR